MNHDHGDVDTPLTEQEVQLLIRKLDGKEKLLVALALNGLSIPDIKRLTANNIYNTARLGTLMNVGGRDVRLYGWTVSMLRPFTLGQNGNIFNPQSTPDWLRQIVLNKTKALLGTPRSFSALRKTFVKRSIEHGVPFDIIVENTGESPETIYKYVKLWQTPRKEAILS